MVFKFEVRIRLGWLCLGKDLGQESPHKDRCTWRDVYVCGRLLFICDLVK